jgi:hypothetical protein
MFVDVGLPTKLWAGPPDPNDPNQYPDDGYPAVIADQRHAYRVETVEEVEAHWMEHLFRHGVEMWTDHREVVPYINRARWLVDCPNCNAGNFAWDRNPYACCLDCGLLVKVMWQPPLVRSQAVRLLAVRPIGNCNWNAHKGETVEELETENRWLLDQPSVEKNGLVVPQGLDVPEALEKYVDPKVA